MSVTVAPPANGTRLSIHNWADNGPANVRSYLNNYGIKFVEGRYSACLDYDDVLGSLRTSHQAAREKRHGASIGKRSRYAPPSLRFLLSRAR